MRNYQARNFMRDGMRPGDKVFFYHSNCAEPGIAGIAEVASDAYPDPSQFDAKSKYFDPGSKREEPRWMLVDVKFVKQAQAHDHAGRTQGPRSAGGHGVAAQGQPAVGDAGGCHGMALSSSRSNESPRAPQHIHPVQTIFFPEPT